ncbi:MAG: DUF1549 domain-containing protein [Opitutales bacterium]
MRGIPFLLFFFAAGAAGAADFPHEVVPILRKHCAECHTGDKKKGGLSMNTRADLIEGSEDGPVVKPGDLASRMLAVIVSKDKDERMPPKGPGLSEAEVAKLRAWVADGLKWDEGFAFKKPAYEPPLKPRTPALPDAIDGRSHPVDRVLDAWTAKAGRPRPAPASDSAFLRRAHLDLIGLLPTPEEAAAFLADAAPDKRERLVHRLLARDVDYADHWMSFWNDLLRNDYSGTGYIDGGRKQITGWLYSALVNNKPYDAFVRELITPDSDSEGFSKGIVWRGAVSAGQLPQLQFSQSVSQAFLGINMKCASCHDSFVDRWKLKDAYGLAAVYATKPMELVRCDVPTGRTATAAWPFPELGQVDPAAPREERLRQLAALLTHPENGRFQRTVVNRLWHRLMGRGVVHPVDAMQTEPWKQDLLDVLANHLVESRYDLRAVLAFIATSEAYRSRAEVLAPDADEGAYVYRGPRAKRLTAEQFVDAVWRVTGAFPGKIDAVVTRAPAGSTPPVGLVAQPVWSNDLTGQRARLPEAGESRTFRREFAVRGAVRRAFVVAGCDNEFQLWFNGVSVASGDNWTDPQIVDLSSRVRSGRNEIVVFARNAGSKPNAAALWVQLHIQTDSGDQIVATSAQWQWTESAPARDGGLPQGAKWKPAAVVNQPGTWASAEARMSQLVAGALGGSLLTPRAGLLKADLLQRTLGRPNREQIVSMRPNELSTLEAIDLANGAALADLVERGAANLLRRKWGSPSALARHVYLAALCREPSSAELAVAAGMVGETPSATGVADLLWSVFMLPEFQTVR